MHCRDIRFTPRCSPMANELYRSNCLYDVRLRSYGVPKLPNFRILAYFPYTRPLKHTFRWPAYSPGVTSQNDSDFSMTHSKVQRGAFRHQRFPATSGRGAEGPQTCPNFCLWQMAISIHNATTLASDLEQSCLKTRNSEDECTFPPNVFTMTTGDQQSHFFWTPPYLRN